jgi:hypothetical protein
MGGTGGVAWAPVAEAGDPQTLQKEAPSDTADPHFEQNAIIPPIGLGLSKNDPSIAQKPFSKQQLSILRQSRRVYSCRSLKEA